MKDRRTESAHGSSTRFSSERSSPVTGRCDGATCFASRRSSPSTSGPTPSKPTIAGSTRRCAITGRTMSLSATSLLRAAAAFACPRSTFTAPSRPASPRQSRRPSPSRSWEPACRPGLRTSVPEWRRLLAYPLQADGRVERGDYLPRPRAVDSARVRSARRLTRNRPAGRRPEKGLRRLAHLEGQPLVCPQHCQPYVELAHGARHHPRSRRHQGRQRRRIRRFLPASSASWPKPTSTSNTCSA